MKDYELLYLSNVHKKDYDNIMAHGLCVKSCPTAEQAADSQWWTENCKSNSKVKCNDVLAKKKFQYAGTESQRICYPTESG